MTQSGDLERLGSLVPGALGKGMPAERRVAVVWPEVVGPEVARNAQPRTLRAGRLVVATSSSVWAQTLQHMAGEIVPRLNEALAVGSEGAVDGEKPADALMIREAVFRPAGWDPGAAAGAAPALGAPPGDLDRGSVGWGAKGPGPRRPDGRRLTAEEESAVEAVRREACDADLGERISRAMRASLERTPGASER